MIFPTSGSAGVRAALSSTSAALRRYSSALVSMATLAGATLMYAQRFFESPTVFAYIVAMLAVGLVLDKAMLTVRERFAVCRDEG